MQRAVGDEQRATAAAWARFTSTRHTTSTRPAAARAAGRTSARCRPTAALRAPIRPRSRRILRSTENARIGNFPGRGSVSGVMRPRSEHSSRPVALLASIALAHRCACREPHRQHGERDVDRADGRDAARRRQPARPPDDVRVPVRDEHRLRRADARAQRRQRHVAKRVTFRLTGLTPGVRYHYRVIASNADGTSTGGRPLVQDEPAAGEAAGRARDGAVQPERHGHPFTALLNPGGAATTYRFQYGTSTAYGVETFGRSIRAGVVPQSVSFRINSLASHTTYHFRVVASNRAGTTFGPDTLAQTGPFPPGRLEVSTRPRREAKRSHPGSSRAGGSCSARASRSRTAAAAARSPCASPRASGRSRVTA